MSVEPVTDYRSTICDQKDAAAEHIRIRAIVKRRRQLLCRCDADVLLALRALRVGEEK